MTSLPLHAPDLFSIVTTAPGSRAPAWKSLFDWPRHGDTHVEYAASTLHQRNLWAIRLDEAMRRADKPVLLIASGESCLATAWWARLSPESYVSKVAGALLFAPRGAEADMFASPRIPLPFPSAVVGRSTSRRALALAESWGSGLLDDGWREGAADGGTWQQAQAALMRLTARVVEREMRVARAFDVVA